MKRIGSFILMLLMLFSLVSCGETNGNQGNTNDSVGSSTQISSTDEDSVQAYENSTAQNDTDIGLRTIKIDSSAFEELSEAQQNVIEYFNDDYLSVPDYDFLRRYPKILQDAQLSVWGTITDIISWDTDSFEFILYMNIGSAEYEEEYDWSAYGGGEILVTGESTDVAYMEGDVLEIYGTFVGIENTSIDGQSYTVPHIKMQKALFDESSAPQDIYRYIPKFDYSLIKDVATTIFGDDIEVREPIVGTDIPEEQYWIWDEVLGTFPCFVVELENQSNAKFSKYFFYTDSSTDVYGGRGDRIQVATDAMGYSNIYRAVEFSADFSHYFLFTYDESLENLTLEYYDVEFNKLWKREFSETTSAYYDYTKNNIYLIANNELYIINTETGEDTFPPVYVGEKVAIRKLSDGVLLVSKGKSDGVMKIGLDGEIIWKTNLDDDTYDAGGIQVVGDNIVMMQYYLNTNAIGDTESSGYHYLLLNSETGTIVQDAKVETYNVDSYEF